MNGDAGGTRGKHENLVCGESQGEGQVLAIIHFHLSIRGTNNHLRQWSRCSSACFSIVYLLFKSLFCIKKVSVDEIS